MNIYMIVLTIGLIGFAAVCVVWMFVLSIEVWRYSHWRSILMFVGSVLMTNALVSAVLFFFKWAVFQRIK